MDYYKCKVGGKNLLQMLFRFPNQATIVNGNEGLFIIQKYANLLSFPFTQDCYGYLNMQAMQIKKQTLRNLSNIACYLM